MFQDYSNEPVPQESTVSGWRIGLIYIGVGLTLPAFMIGATVGANLGLMYGLLATIIAGVILTVVGACTGWIGGSVKLSTYHITKICFGRWGGYGVNLILAIVMFGWFGVTLDLAGTVLSEAVSISFMSEYLWIISLGILMITTAVFGFKGLNKLTFVAVPVIVFALLWTDYNAISEHGLVNLIPVPDDKQFGMGFVISMLVGAWMSGAVVLPDLARYARNPSDGPIASFLCFQVGLFFIMLMSIIPVVLMDNADIVQIMMGMGMPVITAIVVVLASWSSNDNNLYSAALSLSSYNRKYPKWIITIVAGSCGIALSLLGIMDHFISFLVFLSVFLPPIAGVYVADFISHKEKYMSSCGDVDYRCNKVNIFIWIISSIVALSVIPKSEHGFELFSLTTIPALDGLLFAFGSTIIINKLKFIKK